MFYYRLRDRVAAAKAISKLPVKQYPTRRKGRVMVEWQRRQHKALIALRGLTTDQTHALYT